MNLLIAAIASLISVLGYSLISIYIGRVGQKYGAFWTGFWIQILGLPLTLLFLPIFGLKLSWGIYLLPIAIFGIFMSFVFILYCKVLSIGPVSIVQAISKLGVLITFLLAIIFFHETVTLFRILGGILIIAGAIMVSVDVKSLANKKIKLLTKAVPLALLQAVASGILFVILGIGVKYFDGFSTSVGTRLFTVPTFIFISLTQTSSKKLHIGSSWKILFFIAFLDVVSFILYNLSVQTYQISFASIMQGTIPVATAIISYLFFKERLSLSQRVGILIAVLGAISLGM